MRRSMSCGPPLPFSFDIVHHSICYQLHTWPLSASRKDYVGDRFSREDGLFEGRFGVTDILVEDKGKGERALFLVPDD